MLDKYTHNIYGGLYIVLDDNVTGTGVLTGYTYVLFASYYRTSNALMCEINEWNDSMTLIEE